MAEVNTASTTTPKITAGTELWYAKKATPTEFKQIFMVQEIPKLESAPEPKTYSSLESAEEFSTPGKKKSETLEIPLLYVEEQHDELKAISDSKEQLIFYVKLPDSTAAEAGKPLTYTFPGTMHLANDSFADDDMIKESITIYKNGKVTEIKGLPAGAQASAASAETDGAQTEAVSEETAVAPVSAEITATKGKAVSK